MCQGHTLFANRDLECAPILHPTQPPGNNSWALPFGRAGVAAGRASQDPSCPAGPRTEGRRQRGCEDGVARRARGTVSCGGRQPTLVPAQQKSEELPGRAWRGERRGIASPASWRRQVWRGREKGRAGTLCSLGSCGSGPASGNTWGESCRSLMALSIKLSLT